MKPKKKTKEIVGYAIFGGEEIEICKCCKLGKDLLLILEKCKDAKSIKSPFGEVKKVAIRILN